MLLECIRSYLKPVLINKCLTLGAYHLDTLYLRQQGCEDPLLFFEAKRGPPEKKAMDLLLLKFYCNDNCHVGSHKRTQWQYCMAKHVVKAYKREYKLCFFWQFIFSFIFSYFRSNRTTITETAQKDFGRIYEHHYVRNTRKLYWLEKACRTEIVTINERNIYVEYTRSVRYMKFDVIYDMWGEPYHVWRTVRLIVIKLYTEGPCTGFAHPLKVCTSGWCRTTSGNKSELKRNV